MLLLGRLPSGAAPSIGETSVDPIGPPEPPCAAGSLDSGFGPCVADPVTPEGDGTLVGSYSKEGSDFPSALILTKPLSLAESVDGSGSSRGCCRKSREEAKEETSK